VNEAGVEVNRLKQAPESPIETFIKVPVDIEMTGTFMQIKKFFASLVPKKKKPGEDAATADIVERERIVSIDNLTLLDPKVKNREIILTAKFTAVTFRQEDKAPAAPGAPAESALPPAPADGTDALPPANTPKGARLRVEDSLKKGEQRDTLKPEPATGSARLKEGK
jgi:hypothetical protein